VYDFPTTGPITADIRVSAGYLEVSAEEGRSTVSVSVEPMNDTDLSREAASRTTVELRDGKLSIKAPESPTGWLRRRGADVRITAVLPAHSSIELRTASADARCVGVYREAAVNTASGDVVVENVTGNVGANTASGSVRFSRVDGDFTVNSASGDVTADVVGGTAVVRSASGEVELSSVGAGLKLNTASGDVRIGVLRRGAAKVNSASGDILVGVAPGAGVWMDLNSMSGRARSDLDTSSAPVNGADPDVTLRLRSMSGNVVVTRAVA
jgi:DUF4097 and DUF4098 domain-containing protein YvlB